MPKYNNQFARPKYVDHMILDEKSKIVGVVRVKPVGIAWKPRGQQKFYSVRLDKFAAWITDAGTKASRTKS